MMEFPLIKTGLGFDVHRLVVGRRLVLCGVEVPYELGLLGHSDADVALHALADALLGAASMRDIGYHFPDTAAEFEGADSRMLLRRVVEMLRPTHAINNVDVTIVAQRPKLSPYIPEMISNIAADLGLPKKRVSVKATTTERLGFEGRGEGVSAMAVVTVVELSD